MPMNFLCVLRQAIPVDPLPMQLSSTVSPASVYVSIRYSSRATGFCVGRIADRCLSVLKVRTLVGYLSVLSYDRLSYAP